MSDIILETRDLTKHYGGVHALEGANFTLRKGEHIAITAGVPFGVAGQTNVLHLAKL